VSNSIGSIGDHPLDDLAAYALDALDDAERQAIDDHLSRCYACRAELAGHHETLSVLAGDEAPPSAVWQRIAVGIGATDLPDPHGAAPSTGPTTASGPASASVEAEGAGAETGSGPDVAAATGPEVPPVASLAEARARRPSRLRWVAAAASLSAAAAAGAVFGFAMGDSGDGSSNIGGLAEQASKQPGGVLATLQGAGGQPVAQVVADDDGAYIVLDGLENLPEGQAYQLWSLTGPQPVSLGMLGRDGSNTVAFRLPPTITSLAISVAPTSGDSSPNGPFQAEGPVRRS
jgi:anti-sigma-K factor RskA/putative zinc finger protein